MATPTTCSNCGADLATNSEICTACGHKVTEADVSASVQSSDLPPHHSSASAHTGEAAVNQATPSDILSDLRTRWGSEQSPYPLLGVLVALGAIVIGIYAHINFLTAGPTEVMDSVDAYLWLNLALGLAVATLAVAIAVRLSASQTALPANNPDMTVAIGLMIVSVGYATVGLILGQDDRLKDATAWFSAGQIWIFVTIAWFTASRPLARTFGGYRSTSVGLVMASAALAVVVVGLLVGLSDDPNTSQFDFFFDFDPTAQSGFQVFGVKGSTIELFGLNGLLLAVGWLFGIRESAHD